MLNLILCYFSQPKIVSLSVCSKYLHCCIWFTHLFYNCTICSISHVYCSELCWIAANKGFCSLKRVDMILKWCHYVIFVELWNPMEQGIQKSSWILIESFANTVNWNVIIDKFYLLFVCFKRVNHELFLITKINKKITHRIHVSSQSLKLRNEHYQMWN